MPFIKLRLPYVPEIGKNKMKGFANGHYYTKPEYKEAVESLAQIIKAESKSNNIFWLDRKIWINIFFQKPRMNCDVANLVDGMFDGIKQGIDADDCYFSLVADWDYAKNKKPFVDLKISQ